MKQAFLSLTIFILCVLLYLSNAPQEISRANFGGDGGDFLAAALTGGIPHPTGYPTYTLLGGWVQMLPFGSPYWKGVLLSLVPASLSAALLALGVMLGCDRKKEQLGEGLPGAPFVPGWTGTVVGFAAALAWGVSPLLWSQAVLVEVHGLQVLLAASVLGWLALLARRRWNRLQGVGLVGLAWLAGAGLGNHITLVLALPVVVFALWVASQRGLARGWLAAQMGAFLLGLGVYLTLPLRAQQFPPINWGNPQTWEGFRWLVAAESYQHFLFSGDLGIWAQRVAAWAGLLVQQYNAVGIFLGVVGAVQGTIYSRGTNAALAWVFCAYSLFAIAYNTADSMIYLLPAWLVFAAWIGAGLAQVVGWKWRRVRLGWVILLVFLGLTILRIPETHAAVDPRKDSETAEYCERVLNSLPQDALIFTRSEVDTFPLWYFHFGLGRRPDLRIVSLPLTQFNWYQESLLKTYADLVAPNSQSAVTARQMLPGSTTWANALSALNSARVICWSPLPSSDGSLGDPQCIQRP